MIAAPPRLRSVAPTTLVQLWRLPRARRALLLLGVVVAFAVAAPLGELILGVSGLGVDLQARHRPAGLPHLLGTNDLGQDVLWRFARAGRVSLFVGFGAAALSLLLGLLVGLVAATCAVRGGPLRLVDAALMRTVDLALALPTLPLLLLLSVVWRGSGDGGSAALRVALLLALLGWMTTARLARAQALVVWRAGHVEAARAFGAPPLHLLRVHVLPLVLPVVLVQAGHDVSAAILAESALSFLGLGVQPPTPSWGNLLAPALELLHTAPGQVALPALGILVTVWSAHALGDGLRDVLDPRTIP